MSNDWCRKIKYRKKICSMNLIFIFISFVPTFLSLIIINIIVVILNTEKNHPQFSHAYLLTISPDFLCRVICSTTAQLGITFVTYISHWFSFLCFFFAVFHFFFGPSPTKSGKKIECGNLEKSISELSSKLLNIFKWNESSQQEKTFRLHKELRFMAKRTCTWRRKKIFFTWEFEHLETPEGGKQEPARWKFNKMQIITSHQCLSYDAVVVTFSL